MTRRKPYLVRLAELICGCTDESTRLYHDLQQIINEAPNLNSELETSKAIVSSLKDEIRHSSEVAIELQSKIDSLETRNTELGQLINSQKVEIGSLRDGNTSLRRKLDNLNSQTKKIVEGLISCIKNSEILSTPVFDKEKSISFFSTQVEKVLTDVIGISIYEDIDLPFNPTFHKIVSTTPTEDSSKIGFIARSFSKGFRLGDKCIQEQQVEIYN